ncbi:HD family phosphohydrolase [Geochorda subterranea]|uniref:HDIG domain-containing protein n=1 Tax=Geochorda subterranea TaxID=3109564 RepID=A0ABZ1BN01_9FIRM|nr:HDIG domain-containing metalloprotein [Limnochorda sp. LNt]WRP13507.1 HDIG domain-containing protein [Limnochorda sp. LNt]
MRALSGSKSEAGEGHGSLVVARPPAGARTTWRWIKERLGTYRGRLPLDRAARLLGHPAAVAVYAWAVLVILFLPAVTQPTVQLAPGQVSPVDVSAPRTIENRYRTALLQEEAVKDALRRASEDPANYSIDPTAAVQAGDRVRKALTLLKEERSSLWRSAGEAPSSSAANARAGALQPRLLDEARLVLPGSVVAAALRLPDAGFSTVTQQAPALVERIMGTVRIGAGDVDDARQRLAQEVAALDASEEVKGVVQELAAAALVPNLILDPARLERVRQEATRGVQPVMVLQDQVILRRGDVVTEEHVQLLRDLGMLQRGGQLLSSLLGVGLVLAALVAITAFYLARFHGAVVRSRRMATMIASLALLVAVAARVLDELPWSFAGYLTPVALAAMLATVLLDAHVGIVLVAALSVLSGLLFDFDARPVAVGFVTGTVAVFNVHRLGQRSDLTRTGVVAGVAGLVALAALGLLQADARTVAASWAGLANGLLSAVLALGVLPFVESLFGVVSSVRLMELCNPNQPLLRRLLLEAPGTYHHSLMVGNLAETAAEAVGADPVLCRAGALYHDVGKIRRPYFFVENQFGDANPHDRLTPSLSTLIIMSHVKDGVDLARQARVPEVIVEFIRSHHGTDLVRYFYQKALNAEGPEKVKEEDFRYPGPKPRSKETAIVMLADSVEASARALGHATPGRIEGLVRRVIRERLLDGQLDESTLTLQELNTIANAFVRVLTGVYHARIEYPQLEREVQVRRHESK